VPGRWARIQLILISPHTRATAEKGTRWQPTSESETTKEIIRERKREREKINESEWSTVREGRHSLGKEFIKSYHICMNAVTLTEGIVINSKT